MEVGPEKDKNKGELFLARNKFCYHLSRLYLGGYLRDLKFYSFIARGQISMGAKGALVPTFSKKSSFLPLDGHHKNC